MWAVDFAVRLQQTWGPVMAKGIEDTTFYRWHRLVALNEVGGDPAVVEHADPAVLHDWAARQQRDWPRGMTTLSTHDTKRSEDVRARLLAVAEDTASWRACSRAFATAADAAGVDRPTAHLLWQTLVGVGPISRERLHGYLTKAMREAKRHTGWLAVNEEYEARVQAFADSAVADGDLHEAVASAVRENLPGIRAAVLGQKLLQLLLPGTPDTYQGTEVVDLSLVDPDNRRPVDYEDREARLARLAQEAPPLWTTRSCWSPRGPSGSVASCPTPSARRAPTRRWPPRPSTRSASSAASGWSAWSPACRAGSRTPVAGPTTR